VLIKQVVGSPLALIDVERHEIVDVASG
jgi:hypothetical protein